MKKSLAVVTILWLALLGFFLVGFSVVCGWVLSFILGWYFALLTGAPRRAFVLDALATWILCIIQGAVCAHAEQIILIKMGPEPHGPGWG